MKIITKQHALISQLWLVNWRILKPLYIAFNTVAIKPAETLCHTDNRIGYQYIADMPGKYRMSRFIRGMRSVRVGHVRINWQFSSIATFIL